MPTLEDNRRFWSTGYDWKDWGDEWSAEWGGPFMQWYGTLLPRIKAHVPADRILEIGCGCGRWTQYLKDLCTQLIAVDLAERCLEVCRRRFAAADHIRYGVTDGTSLPMVGDASVDFVFSFDSLVHADERVIEAYLLELSRVLKRDGVAFIHHSNLGQYAWLRRIPGLERLLPGLGVVEKDFYGRDFSVDAGKVAMLAERHGLCCISQEIIGTRTMMIDCLSTIVRRDSSKARANRILRNPGFVEEKKNLARLAPLYQTAPQCSAYSRLRLRGW